MTQTLTRGRIALLHRGITGERPLVRVWYMTYHTLSDKKTHCVRSENKTAAWGLGLAKCILPENPVDK